MSSLIRATNLRGYIPLVRELGGDPAPLLERFGLPADAGENPDAFLSFAAMAMLLQHTAETLDCPDLGLRLSQWQGLSVLGPVAVIARHSSTLAEAIGAIRRYLHVHSPALSLSALPDPVEGCAGFEYRVTEPGIPPTTQGFELAMGNAAGILDLLTAGKVRPTAVLFTHPQQGPAQAYTEALGCPARFSQPWCGFLVPREALALPIDSADPAARRIADAYMGFDPGSDTSTSARVRALIGRLLPLGTCSAEAVAAELAVHPRTLQRRLLEEGRTYHGLVEQVRRERALEYLAAPAMSLSQIAGLLGYTEQSALSRSCRRWFEQTPRQLRAGMLVADPGSHSSGGAARR